MQVRTISLSSIESEEDTWDHPESSTVAGSQQDYLKCRLLNEIENSLASISSDTLLGEDSDSGNENDSGGHEKAINQVIVSDLGDFSSISSSSPKRSHHATACDRNGGKDMDDLSASTVSYDRVMEEDKDELGTSPATAPKPAPARHWNLTAANESIISPFVVETTSTSSESDIFMQQRGKRRTQQSQSGSNQGINITNCDNLQQGTYEGIPRDYYRATSGSPLSSIRGVGGNQELTPSDSKVSSSITYPHEQQHRLVRERSTAVQTVPTKMGSQMLASTKETDVMLNSQETKSSNELKCPSAAVSNTNEWDRGDGPTSKQSWNYAGRKIPPNEGNMKNEQDVTVSKTLGGGIHDSSLYPSGRNYSSHFDHTQEFIGKQAPQEIEQQKTLSASSSPKSGLENLASWGDSGHAYREEWGARVAGKRPSTPIIPRVYKEPTAGSANRRYFDCPEDNGGSKTECSHTQTVSKTTATVSEEHLLQRQQYSRSIHISSDENGVSDNLNKRSRQENGNVERKGTDHMPPASAEMSLSDNFAPIRNIEEQRKEAISRRDHYSWNSPNDTEHYTSDNEPSLRRTQGTAHGDDSYMLGCSPRKNTPRQIQNLLESSYAILDAQEKLRGSPAGGQSNSRAGRLRLSPCVKDNRTYKTISKTIDASRSDEIMNSHPPMLQEVLLGIEALRESLDSMIDYGKRLKHLEGKEGRTNKAVKRLYSCLCIFHDSFQLLCNCSSGNRWGRKPFQQLMDHLMGQGRRELSRVYRRLRRLPISSVWKDDSLELCISLFESLQI